LLLLRYWQDKKKEQNFTKGKKCLENWGVFVLEFLGS